jgi:hypothetical protein
MAVQAGDQNLVVLTLYFIVIIYTFNRMIESIDDLVILNYEKNLVEQQLTEQNLQDKIGISFKTGTYSLEKFKDDLRELSISIENKSESLAVYIDWDNSTWVVEHTKQSRRVIRKSPDITRDLAVPQVPSIIAPKKTATSSITAEDVFQRDPETGVYKADSPLINVNILKSAPNNKLYRDFITSKKNIEFSLQLVLRISDLRVGISPGVNVPPISIINCPFTIKKLPWTYALPWNKKRAIV